MNDRELRGRRSLLLPFGFLLALRVGHVLAAGSLVQRAPLVSVLMRSLE